MGGSALKDANALAMLVSQNFATGPSKDSQLNLRKGCLASARRGATHA
jgi:hypothetical protein